MPLNARRWSGSTKEGDHISMAVSEDDEGDRHHRAVRYRLRHQKQNTAHGERVVDASGEVVDHDNDDDELEVILE